MFPLRWTEIACLRCIIRFYMLYPSPSVSFLIGAWMLFYRIQVSSVLNKSQKIDNGPVFQYRMGNCKEPFLILTVDCLVSFVKSHWMPHTHTKVLYTNWIKLGRQCNLYCWFLMNVSATKKIVAKITLWVYTSIYLCKFLHQRHCKLAG